MYNQASKVNYRQIYKDVWRTWNEYWDSANSIETEACNKYAGMDCIPLALNAGITATGAGGLVLGSTRLGYSALGLGGVKWMAYDGSAEGVGWLAVDAATLRMGSFLNGTAAQGVDHVIGVHSWLIQTENTANQMNTGIKDYSCKVPMRCN